MASKAGCVPMAGAGAMSSAPLGELPRMLALKPLANITVPFFLAAAAAARPTTAGGRVECYTSMAVRSDAQPHQLYAKDALTQETREPLSSSHALS